VEHVTVNPMAATNTRMYECPWTGHHRQLA
jgi:hypothetical protein